jgi:NDP-sugar pyrophosphorylase family protein
MAVGHLHKQIEEHFEDGKKFGCQILYLLDDPATPLGTSRPLAMLGDFYPELDSSALVFNGDLIRQFTVADLLESHDVSGVSRTEGFLSFTHEVDFGVLDICDDGVVTAISEKPIIEKTVSAGIHAC